MAVCPFNTGKQYHTNITTSVSAQRPLMPSKRHCNKHFIGYQQTERDQIVAQDLMLKGQYDAGSIVKQ